LFARDLHVSLAVASIVAVSVAAIEAAARAITGRPPARFSTAVSAVTLVLLGMTAAGGLAILVRGDRPRAFLHFVYAAAAFGLILLGDSLSARSAPRRRAGARLLAALVTLGVLARLFATG
jgi:hypothetical protein